MEICKHLSEILKLELSRGNKVVSIDEGKWTNAALVFNLQKKIDTIYIKNNLALSESVLFWENNDTHYAFGLGYFCKECKNAILSPDDIN